MDLTLPSAVVTVPLTHPSNGAHEDIFVAIRNAFRAARRQLDQHFQAHPGDLRPVEPRLPEPRLTELPAASVGDAADAAIRTA
jgi:hypothetical protein